MPTKQSVQTGHEHEFMTWWDSSGKGRKHCGTCNKFYPSRCRECTHCLEMSNAEGVEIGGDDGGGASARKRTLEDRLMEECKCMICLNYILGPIYQCINSHLICEECRYGLKSTEYMCPNRCYRPINGRNYALEKSTVDLIFPCIHDGCQQRMDREALYNHSKSCPYKNFRCPFCKNSFRPEQFLLHLKNVHDIPIQICHEDKYFNIHFKDLRRLAPISKPNGSYLTYATIYKFHDAYFIVFMTIIRDCLNCENASCKFSIYIINHKSSIAQLECTLYFPATKKKENAQIKIEIHPPPISDIKDESDIVDDDLDFRVPLVKSDSYGTLEEVNGFFAHISHVTSSDFPPFVTEPHFVTHLDS